MKNNETSISYEPSSLNEKIKELIENSLGKWVTSFTANRNLIDEKELEQSEPNLQQIFRNVEGLENFDTEEFYLDKDNITAYPYLCLYAYFQNENYYKEQISSLKDVVNELLLESASSNNITLVYASLKLGADANIANIDGDTPLHIASWDKDFNMVELLLKHNADANIANNHSLTPLHIAAQKKDFNMVELLLKHNADANIANNHSLTPLHIASWDKDFNMVELLLKHNADANIANNHSLTPLHIAAQKKDFNMVELLLKHNADINAKNIGGNTALHYATRFFSLPNKGFSILEFLLKHNADPNIANNSGQTPLHMAALISNKECILLEIVLRYKPDINAKDNMGETILHYAVKNNGYPYEKSPQLIKTLLFRSPTTIVFLEFSHLKQMSTSVMGIIESYICDSIDIHIKDNKGKKAIDYLEDYAKNKTEILNLFKTFEEQSASDRFR